MVHLLINLLTYYAAGQAGAFLQSVWPGGNAINIFSLDVYDVDRDQRTNDRAIGRDQNEVHDLNMGQHCGCRSTCIHEWLRVACYTVKEFNQKASDCALVALSAFVWLLFDLQIISTPYFCTQCTLYHGICMRYYMDCPQAALISRTQQTKTQK